MDFGVRTTARHHRKVPPPRRRRTPEPASLAPVEPEIAIEAIAESPPSRRGKKFRRRGCRAHGTNGYE